jgi:hypothetical protein
MSYFEIYMERIRDLLCDGNTNLQIHENRERGVYVSPALFALCLARDEEDAAVEVGNKTVCVCVCVRVGGGGGCTHADTHCRVTQHVLTPLRFALACLTPTAGTCDTPQSCTCSLPKRCST